MVEETKLQMAMHNQELQLHSLCQPQLPQQHKSVTSLQLTSIQPPVL